MLPTLSGMAQFALTPLAALPAPGTVPADAALLPSGYNTAAVYLDISAGTGTFCLIEYGPGGIWRQYGPSWTAGAQPLVDDPARVSVSDSGPGTYHVLKVSGTPTITAAWIKGEHR